MKLTDEQRLVFLELSSGREGATARRLSIVTGMSQRKVAAKLVQLERLGIVRRRRLSQLGPLVRMTFWYRSDSWWN